MEDDVNVVELEVTDVRLCMAAVTPSVLCFSSLTTNQMHFFVNLRIEIEQSIQFLFTKLLQNILLHIKENKNIY